MMIRRKTLKRFMNHFTVLQTDNENPSFLALGEFHVSPSSIEIIRILPILS